MSNDTVFLETTIQALRKFGEDAKKDQITNLINTHKVSVSSTYVRMEFTHTFIRDLIYLYSLTNRLNNFSEMNHTINKLNYYRPRRLSRMISIIALYYADHAGDVDKIDSLEKMQYWLPHVIDESWDWVNNSENLSVDGLVDETGCVKGNTPPHKVGDAYEPFGKCKKSDKKCKIGHFFIKNKKEFEAILNKLKELPADKKDPEMSKTEEILTKALNYPDNLHDSDDCWKCGDAIISVECPKDASLFTTNLKHYRLLCPMLNKTVLGVDDDSVLNDEAPGAIAGS